MADSSFAAVRQAVLTALAARLVAAGMAVDSLPDAFDLRSEGILDSLGFVELLAELEVRLGAAVDLEHIEPADMTKVGPLSRYIAERCGPFTLDQDK